MNILIYDQSIKILTLLNRSVTEIFPHANIKVADNVNGVLKITNICSFDIAIVDIDNINGQFNNISGTIRLSNNSALIITTTSFPDSRVLIKLKSLGIDYYFDKHYQINDLIDILNVMAINRPELSQSKSRSELAGFTDVNTN